MTDINYPSRALNSATDSVAVTGTVTATNPSVAATGGAVPASATYAGMTVGGTLTGLPGNSSGLLTSSAQSSSTGTLASPSTGDVIASTVCANYRHFELFLTIGTATVKVQQSPDNVTWYDVTLVNFSNPSTLPSTTVSASGFYVGDVRAQYIRVTATANSAGSISATLQLVDGPTHEAGARYVSLAGGSSTIGTVAIDQSTPGTTNGVQVNAALPSGSNIIGSVKIDQTTPGTTNGVQVNAALPAGSNIIGAIKIDQTTPGTTNGVQINAAIPTGANTIGAVNQAGTWTVQPGNTANTTPWLTTISQGGNSAAVSASNALKTDAVQSGTWNINNISGTVSLPTGAATSAKQPALGTAGSASSDVITVQGIASMTALKVDGSAVTQPVSIATIPAESGRSKVLLYRNNYSSVNVTTSAYVQVTASTSGAINRLYIADTSGSAMILATGGAGAEVDQLYIGPGGSDAPYELNIPTATRIAIKALDVNATSGQMVLTALS